jgi:hypothetical protein
MTQLEKSEKLASLESEMKRLLSEIEPFVKDGKTDAELIEKIVLYNSLKSDFFLTLAIKTDDPIPSRAL